MDNYLSYVSNDECVRLFKEHTRKHGLSTKIDIGRLNMINVLLSAEPLVADKPFLKILDTDEDMHLHQKTLAYIQGTFGLNIADYALWPQQLFVMRNSIIENLVNTHGRIFGALYLRNVSKFCEVVNENPAELLLCDGQGRNILEFAETFAQPEPSFFNGIRAFLILRFGIPVKTLPYDPHAWMAFVASKIELEKADVVCAECISASSSIAVHTPIPDSSDQCH